MITKNGLRRDIDLLRIWRQITSSMSISRLRPWMKPETGNGTANGNAAKRMKTLSFSKAVFRWGNGCADYPGLNHHAIPKIKGGRSLRRRVGMTVVRLKVHSKSSKIAKKNFPDVLRKCVTDMCLHGGTVNDSLLARMTGEGQYADIIQQLFARQKKYFNADDAPFDLTKFRKL